VQVAVKELGEALLDFVFPRLCCGCNERILEPRLLVCRECADALPELKQPICPTCGCPNAEFEAEDRCADCPSGKVYFEKSRGCVAFGGTAAEVVERLKYHGRQEYAAFMAEVMLRQFLREFSHLSEVTVVPVPLYPARERERGYNQSQLLASALAKRLRTQVVAGAVLRNRPTPSQTRLTRKQRMQNIRGAFGCTAGAFEGRSVLLIDDVYTTGATLNECARVLRQDGGATAVNCLAFGRATLD